MTPTFISLYTRNCPCGNVAEIFTGHVTMSGLQIIFGRCCDHKDRETFENLKKMRHRDSTGYFGEWYAALGIDALISFREDETQRKTVEIC